MDGFTVVPRDENNPKTNPKMLYSHYLLLHFMFCNVFGYGVETLHDGEIFLMRFESENRGYEVVGYDFEQMAKSILKLYNFYCRGEKYSFKDLAKDGYQFRAFRVKIGEAFDDGEEYSLKNFIGDYLDKYRPKGSNCWADKPYQKWNN